MLNINFLLINTLTKCDGIRMAVHWDTGKLLITQLKQGSY